MRPRASALPFALPAVTLLVIACGAEPPPAPATPPLAATAAPTAPALAAPPVAATSLPAPPATRRDDFHETLHGVDIVDPYRWLEDQESPETRAWIDAENAYTHALLDGLEGRDAIRARLAALEHYDDRGTPYELGGRLFTMNHRANDDLWTMHVAKLDKRGTAGKDDVLLDPHPLSARTTPRTSS